MPGHPPMPIPPALDLHATSFAISNAAELTTARVDAEGIPMPSLLGNYCP
jgi:hypothetical protein